MWQTLHRVRAKMMYEFCQPDEWSAEKKWKHKRDLEEAVACGDMKSVQVIFEALLRNVDEPQILPHRTPERWTEDELRRPLEAVLSSLHTGVFRYLLQHGVDLGHMGKIDLLGSCRVDLCEIFLQHEKEIACEKHSRNKAKLAPGTASLG